MGDFYHWIYRQPQGIKELISENILFLNWAVEFVPSVVKL